MSNGSKSEYEVGYGKPPKESRFRKGQSGNPKGRKKKPNAAPVPLVDQIHKIMNEPIMVSQNGNQTSMPVFEAALRKLVSRAVNVGDQWAFRILLPIMSEGQTNAIARKEPNWDAMHKMDQHEAARVYFRMMRGEPI